MFFSALTKIKEFKNLARGFTLIELLVVISIIGLLVGVATVSYSNVQMKGRDGKRKADLAAVQQALARFYDDNGAYPLSIKNYNGSTQAPDFQGAGSHKGKIDSITCSTGPVATNNTSSLAGVAIAWGSPFTCNGKTYMAKLPDDNYPRTDTNPDPSDHGYVYTIYPVRYYNALNYGGTHYGPEPPVGWCQVISYSDGTSDGRTIGAVATIKNCQHYTLWTTLENNKDPDIQKTLLDPVCRAAAHYEQLWDNPDPNVGNWNPGPFVNTQTYQWPDTIWHKKWNDNTYNWATWSWEDPNNASQYSGNPDQGTRNYCVHDNF